MTRIPRHDNLFRKFDNHRRRIENLERGITGGTAGFGGDGGSGGPGGSTERTDVLLGKKYGMQEGTSGIILSQNGQAIDDMISQANENNGGAIKLPPGIYHTDRIPEAITTGNIDISGYGASTQIISPFGTFWNVGTYTDGVTYCSISNMTLTCTGNPDPDEHVFNLEKGGHIMCHDFILNNISGLVKVGSRGMGRDPGGVPPVSVDGTVLNSNAAFNLVKIGTTTAAHGLKVGDGIIFTGHGAGTLPTGVGTGIQYYISGLGTGIFAGGGWVALQNRAGTNVSVNSDGASGGDWNGGDFIGRVQRYEMCNMIGTWNNTALRPDRIHIINGSSGLYTGMEIIGSNLNGGTHLFLDACGRGTDQHWFSDIHFQGGSHDWVEVDCTEGPCDNWVFSHCVFDGSEGHNFYIHDSAGASGGGIIDFHVLDCHTTTRSGDGIFIQKDGPAAWKGLQWIGGRYKIMNGNGLKMAGSQLLQIDNALFMGVQFLQDSTPIDHIVNNSTESGIPDHTIYVGGTSTAEDAHYLQINDEVHFSIPGTAPTRNGGTAISPATPYYVIEVPTPSTLRISAVAPGGATQTPTSLDTFNGSGVRLYVAVTACCVIGGNGTRFLGNTIAGFANADITHYDYCVQPSGSPVNYQIQMNTGRGILTGWQTAGIAGTATTTNYFSTAQNAAAINAGNSVHIINFH